MSGNCSISVTDNQDVRPDSLVNIFTTPLLTSDLKGRITNPAWYFAQDENSQRAEVLDMLMLTHGWRRYDYPKKVGISSPAMQMIEQLETDDLGRFSLKGFEFPDTTKYLINAFSKKGGANVVLTMNKKKNPVVAYLFASSLQINTPTSNNVNMDYLSKVDTKLFYEQGIRHIFLEEVVVTTSKAPRYKTQTEIIATHVYREAKFKKKGSQSLGASLGQMVPGVWFKGSYLQFRGMPMALYLNDILVDKALAAYLLNNLVRTTLAPFHHFRLRA